MVYIAEQIMERPNMKKHTELIEVTVFLFLVIPSTVIASLNRVQASMSFPALAAASIFQDLGLLGLVVFFVWRNGEGLASVGLRWAQPVREALLGIVFFFPALGGVSLLLGGLRRVGMDVPEAPPSYLTPEGDAQSALAVLLLLVVAVSEEVLFRGYLLLRFRQLTKKVSVAVILSILFFSVGHLYEGIAGVIGVALLGLIYAVVYVWRGSLMMPIVMHFMHNYSAIFMSSVSGK
jgi:membrane protease YdiL (CAAX protease family)